jgi:hypothetical protein
MNVHERSQKVDIHDRGSTKNSTSRSLSQTHRRPLSENSDI